MKGLPDERAIILANYIIDNKQTIRKTADVFNISKSTVHKDVTQRLFNINFELYCQVKEVLEKNKSERHIRGGEATKNKYKTYKIT